MPKISKFYWTEWGDVPFIARADMYDGSDMEYIIESTALQWPYGLAVDVDTNEIFWCDGGLGRIEKASLIGKNRQLLSQRIGQHYYGLTIDRTHVYVTSWSESGLQRLSRHGGPLATYKDFYPNAHLHSIVNLFWEEKATSSKQSTTKTTQPTITNTTPTTTTTTETTTTEKVGTKTVTKTTITTVVTTISPAE